MLDKITNNHAFPYVAPFVLFMLFLMLEGIHASALYLVYPIKTIAVGCLILWLFSRLPSFDFDKPLLSIGVGVVVFVLWVKLGPLISFSEMTGGFNPFSFEDQQIAWGLLLIRIFGAVIIVPVMEELFWRGFLMRYIINEKFQDVALGTYTHLSFWLTTLLFASVHGPLAPIAFITGIFYGLLFIKTKSLGNVILAHAVTNLLLGIYVVKTSQWQFW